MAKFQFNQNRVKPSMVVSLVVASILLCFDTPIVFAQGKTPHEIQKSCKKFVQGFYDWYVPSLTKNTKGPTAEVAIASKKASFDPLLYRKLKDDFDAQAKVSGEIVGLDFDPFLNAQDIMDKYVIGKVTEKKGGNYLVAVHSIAGGKRNPKADVTPEVALRKGKWQFVNFHYGKSEFSVDENLISILKVLKQERDKYGSK